MNGWDALAGAVRTYWETILGIGAGLLVALWFYLKSRKVRRPYFAARDSNLVKDLSSKFEGLKVMFGSQEVRNFTSSRVVFWNGGRETINREDVVNADPVVMQFSPEARPLAFKVIHQSYAPNQLSAHLDTERNRVRIEFEYLDHYDGGVIQVLHSGRATGHDYEFRGSVKGHGPVRQREVPWFWAKAREFGGVVLLFAFLGGLGVVVDLSLPWNLIGGAVLVAAMWATWQLVKEQSTQIPRKFRNFAEPNDQDDEDAGGKNNDSD